MAASNNRRLTELLSANEPKQRAAWGRGLKEAGRGVIGLGCKHVPEEIVHAAGLVPMQLTGTWDPGLEKVGLYRPATLTGQYTNHVLEAALRKEYDFLSGMITTNWDEDRRQLFDMWQYLNITPLCLHLNLPRIDTPLGIGYYAHWLKHLKGALEKFTGKEITHSALWNSIELYNRWRDLMREVWVMSWQETPPLSGRESLQLVEASFVMPKEKFIEELEAIMPELRTRRCNARSTRPRLMITGDMLDAPAYVDLIEKYGLVVLNDLEAGARYFDGYTRTEGDPLEALAERYVAVRPPGPRFFSWGRKGIDKMITWCRQFRVDGVINLPMRDDLFRLYQGPYLARRLDEAKIRHTTIEVQYHLEMPGQMETRVQAFVESLE